MSSNKEIFEGLKKWYDHSTKQMKMLRDSDPSEGKVTLQHTDGNSTEISGDVLKGLKLGMGLALEIIGPFPITAEVKSK